MLKGKLIHPQILAALARAGHGSRVLVSDGNFPHWTARGPNAEVVYLNLMPGVPTITDVLRALTSTIPIEAAAVMLPNTTGPYAMKGEPDIWSEFRAILGEAEPAVALDPVERFAFYDLARGGDVCLTIATGDQRAYANLLVTIGVVR